MSDYQEVHESFAEEAPILANGLSLADGLSLAPDLSLVPDPALIPDLGRASVYSISPAAGVEEEDAVLEERPPARRRSHGRRMPAEAPPLRRVLEAVLFATDRPVTVEQLRFALPDCDPDRIEDELRALEESYRDSQSGFLLQRSGGGYLLQTDPELHEYVHQFLVGKKRSRLSRAAMETLAIIAYRQPITRGEMELIRGVDCGQVLHTLLERDLVSIRGRSQALGRPLLYGTTAEFLHYFGINSLADLPSLEELRALVGEDPLDDPEIRRALEAEGLVEGEPTELAEVVELTGAPERADAVEPAETSALAGGTEFAETAEFAGTADFDDATDFAGAGDLSEGSSFPAAI